MKGHGKLIRRLLAVLAVLLVLFAALNLAWYLTAFRPFDRYAQQMEESLPVFIQMDAFRCVGEDEEGYTYSLKRPDWLQWGGNLTVGVPVLTLENGEEIPFVDGLIVWPNAPDTERYGLILYEYTADDAGMSAQEWQLYIDETGACLDDTEESAVYQQLLDVQSSIVALLREKFVAPWA